MTNSVTPAMIDAAEANIREDHRTGKISKEQFQKEMLIVVSARHEALADTPPQTRAVGTKAVTEHTPNPLKTVDNEGKSMSEKQVEISITVPDWVAASIERQATDRGIKPLVWSSSVFAAGLSATLAIDTKTRLTPNDLNDSAAASLKLWGTGKWDKASTAAAINVSEDALDEAIRTLCKSRSVGL